MPPPPAAIAWVAAQVGTYAAEIATTLGASAQLAATIGQIALYVTQTVLTVGATYATNLLFAPPMPSPEAMRQPVGETIIKRIRGYGRCRVAGGRMLSEAVKHYLHRVFAYCDGRTDGIETWWFHDNEVEFVDAHYVVSVDGKRYDNGDGELSYLDWRLGVPTETPYAELVADMADADLAATWGVNHRGDGQSSYYARFKAPKIDFYTKYFPDGKPVINILARMLCCYDWRLDDTVAGGAGPHRRNDPSTWTWSKNPVVQFVHELMFFWGYAWESKFLPTLDILTAEADLADSLATKADSTTEPLYECHFAFTSDVTLSEIIKQFRLSCDGWVSRTRGGAIIFRVGHYIEPTITITKEEIIDYDWSSFVDDARAVNTLQISYISPDNQYRVGEAANWVIDADVTARGAERIQPFGPLPVHSKRQARYLAKREFPRLLGGRGTVKTKLSAKRALGHRYVRFQFGPDEADELADIVFEITGDPSIVDNGMHVQWQVVAADPNVDDWNPATDENGTLVITPPDRPPATDVGAPEIDDVKVFYQYASGSYTPRLQVIIVDPERDDLTVVVRHKRHDGTAWAQEANEDQVPFAAGLIYVLTGLVGLNTDVDVEAAWRDGQGGLSPWSDTFTINTTGGVGDNPIPGDPGTGGDPTDPGFPGELP